MEAMLKEIVSKTWYMMARLHSEMNSKCHVFRNKTLPIMLRSNLDSASRSCALMY